MNHQNNFLIPIVLDEEQVEIEQNSTHKTTLITIGFDGTPASGFSRYGSDQFSLSSISADGRYVAFSWYATNLVPNDTNDSHDVFVRDLQTGITELVSVASDGTPGNDYSILTSMSSDGRFVTFYSAASNLVPDDTNNVVDIFVRDRHTGITELVSVATDGAPANDDSIWPSISDDGRYVAFSSWASNLVLNNNSSESYNYIINDHQVQQFVRDRQTGVTELVSVATDGTPVNNNTGSSYYAVSISGDGRYVAFVSEVNNIVPNDKDNNFDIFVRDLQQETTELVSVISDDFSNDFSDDYWDISSWPSISADGRYIAFKAYDTRLLTPYPIYSDYDDFNVYWDDFDAYLKSYDVKTFIRDRQTGVTELVSVATDGTSGNKDSDPYGLGGISISDDGRYVAFGSGSSNFVLNDINNSSDIFVRDRQTGITRLVSVAPDGSPGNLGLPFSSLISSFNPSISADGRYVVFSSGASNLVSNDTNNSSDIFVRDLGQSSIVASDLNIIINRFQNSNVLGTYLYVGGEESQSIGENFPNFIEEGQVFKVAVEPKDDLIRINRFQNSNVPGTYLYAGEGESQSIRENFPNFIEEGIAFYVYPGSADIGVDFYRFQNLDVPGTYIFVNDQERQNILANYPNFVEEGIAFEVEV